MIKRFILWIALGLLLSLGLGYPTRATDSVQMAKTAYDAGQYGTAIESLEQVLEQPQNPLEQAQTYGWLSLAQQKLGQWDKAQINLDKSFALLESLAQTASVKQVQGQIYNTQGQLNLITGHPETALDAWQKAEKSYRNSDDRIGTLGSQINQSKALQVLGLYRRAENLLQKIEQDIQGQSDAKLKTYGLQSIGEIRRYNGDLVQSQESLRQALDLVQSPILESQLRLSLGNTELALGQRATETQEAQTYFQAALAEYQKAVAIAPVPLTKVQGQLNQLNLLRIMGQFSEAQASIGQIKENLRVIPASRASVYAHVNFADSLMSLPTPPTAIVQTLATAIQQAQQLQDRRAESYALGTLGKLYEQQLFFEAARQTTQEALLIAQSINAPEIAYQWQWQLGRILRTQSDRAIPYYTQAFNTLNQLRGDLVALNPEIQFSFREQVEPVYRELVDLLLQDKEPSQSNLRQARQVIEALQVAELDNFFRDACTPLKPSSIETIDPHAAIVYPIILKNRLEVILQLPGSEQLRHVAQQGITATQVDSLVQQLRQLLNRRSTSPEQIKQASGILYDWLIRPFESQLQQDRITTLVFVLEGSLRNIPMAVLYDGEKYAIERYAIAVTPSLQLLEPKPLKKESLIALVAGATDAPSFKQEGLGTLDNVASEISGIEQEVQKTQPLEDQNFLQENIQRQINRVPFNVVHLATHGKFSSNPEQTYLLDWNKRIGVKDLDVLLRSQTNEKPIELLILSACETATGDKRAALGLAGVAIRAGARSTLATLWQINDASTAQFMLEFYQQLQNPNVTKAEALRNVQLSFLHQGAETDYNRPYHWAAFILVGNWL